VLALLRTRKLLHDEVIDTYLLLDTFSFSYTYDLYYYIQMIRLIRRMLISRIELHFRGELATQTFELLAECKRLAKLWIGANSKLC
jgi:hypothetical protein